MDSRTEQTTRRAYLLSSLVNAPFWALYNMLLFILYKDLHATPLQITLFITLKPVVSLLSVYWSTFIHKRPDRLRTNLITASLLGHLPFFFLPFFHRAWFVIAAGTIFFIFHRGIIPAWMEILKLNVPHLSRTNLFSLGSIISYVGSIALPLLFGRWLDIDSSSWHWLFPLTALVSLCSMFFQWRIPIANTPPADKPNPLKGILLKPWKTSLELMRTRPDFLRFQLGFMLGGGGIMLWQPALPVFFVDFLKMSYTELAIALSICKGIGFALTSPFWAKAMRRLSLFRISSLVTSLTALFALTLIFAQWGGISYVFIAYLIYGFMQAGSELSWHLSGPVFSKEEDSSAYSAVNVLTVGLRGLVMPFLGSLLCLTFTAPTVLMIGGLFCLAGTIQLTLAHRHQLAILGK